VRIFREPTSRHVSCLEPSISGATKRTSKPIEPRGWRHGRSFVVEHVPPRVGNEAVAVRDLDLGPGRRVSMMPASARMKALTARSPSSDSAPAATNGIARLT
jgi:hypothetical protein